MSCFYIIIVYFGWKNNPHLLVEMGKERERKNIFISLKKYVKNA